MVRYKVVDQVDPYTHRTVYCIAIYSDDGSIELGLTGECYKSLQRAVCKAMKLNHVPYETRILEGCFD